jgi:aconitate hydratase
MLKTAPVVRRNGVRRAERFRIMRMIGQDSLKTRRTLTVDGKTYNYFSLPEAAKSIGDISRLPYSLKVLLENVLRFENGTSYTVDDAKAVAGWLPAGHSDKEVPFRPARILLQDFTGVPAVVDLAAMRDGIIKLGGDPRKVNPLLPVDLVIDHSVMVDHAGTATSLQQNVDVEFERNGERYEFLRWGQSAFDNFRVVPPGTGICHQVNLEYLAQVVWTATDTGDTFVYPDSCYGTDSHTTMVNGLGVLGWGVGGIEAEAAMLGQPVYLLMPDVVGMELTGRLREGVTATDLVLTVTEMLRREKVVGQFVEFCGAGTRSLSVPDRATIANMAPEYGATMGFFPVDDKTIDYFKGTGRTEAEIEAFEAYFRAQQLYGIPLAADIDYSRVIRLDLASVAPSLAGPKRPQDRIDLGRVKTEFSALYSAPAAESGFNRPAAGLDASVPLADGRLLRNGDVLIAAITSCTNTSNPGVMLAAGLLAKKAVEAGLTVPPHVKTSLAPGSRIVTEYLEAAGLLPFLDQLGFNVAAYGCTTCIGNSGDLAPEIEAAIVQNDLVCAAVLSGNRNFEARIHPNLKANFLASPPLVVAYAIAGTVLRDLTSEPVGTGSGGRAVFLADIWPSGDEIDALMKFAMNGPAFRSNYAQLKTAPGTLWERIEGPSGTVYSWPPSTYIAEPPFFQGFTMQPPAVVAGVQGARILALFGDSITTDHISPAGSFKETTPAGQYLLAHGVRPADFNSYGSRRGNHEVMVRGTFANVRIANLMLPPRADGSREEGGFTIFQLDTDRGARLPIYDAAMKYIAAGVPTVVFAGEEYGTGSSRDWAAKGTQLLGIRAVVARSFERIHRSNLIGMGVLPLQFKPGDAWQSLKLTGDETVEIRLADEIAPLSDARLLVTSADGATREVPVTLRIDTAIEVDYYKHGGILPFVLRQLLAA